MDPSVNAVDINNAPTATQLTTATIPTSKLLLLPWEIRTQILSYLLISPEFFEDPLSGWPKPDGMHYPLPSPTILETCHQLYYEGTALLYSRNEFQFTSPHLLRHFAYSVSTFEYHTLTIKYLSLVINMRDYGLSDQWIAFFKRDRLDHYFPNVQRITFNYPELNARWKCWGVTQRLTNPASLSIVEFEQVTRLILRQVRAPVVRVDGLIDDQNHPVYREEREWQRQQPQRQQNWDDKIERMENQRLDGELEEAMSTDGPALVRDRIRQKAWQVRVWGKKARCGKGVVAQWQAEDEVREGALEGVRWLFA